MNVYGVFSIRLFETKPYLQSGKMWFIRSMISPLFSREVTLIEWLLHIVSQERRAPCIVLKSVCLARIHRPNMQIDETRGTLKPWAQVCHTVYAQSEDTSSIEEESIYVPSIGIKQVVVRIMKDRNQDNRQTHRHLALNVLNRQNDKSKLWKLTLTGVTESNDD